MCKSSSLRERLPMSTVGDILQEQTGSSLAYKAAIDVSFSSSVVEQKEMRMKETNSFVASSNSKSDRFKYAIIIHE